MIATDLVSSFTFLTAPNLNDEMQASVFCKLHVQIREEKR